MACRRDTWLEHGPGAYMLFGEEGGEFAFDCLTGSIHGADIEFDWDGNDESEEVSSHGWAEFQADGSLQDEICLSNVDNIPFIARRQTSSTACEREY